MINEDYENRMRKIVTNKLMCNECETKNNMKNGKKSGMQISMKSSMKSSVKSGMRSGISLLITAAMIMTSVSFLPTVNAVADTAAQTASTASTVDSSTASSTASDTAGGKHLRIIFTHDIHSFVDESIGFENGQAVEHGDIAKLKTLVDEYKTSDAIYVDGGDIAMGTLYQSGYTTEAYEMRLLGMAGCDVTTVGNHEWDYGGYGFAQSMNTAKKYKDAGETLPMFVQSNIDISGTLTDEQQAVKDAMDSYGASKYKILERDGVKIAVFGLLGPDAISDAPTSGMVFKDYIEAAKDTVSEIKSKENPDIIICLSHSGTEDDGETGDDFELLKEVPDINVVLSAHSHTVYDKPIQVGDSFLVSAKCYLYYMGVFDVDIVDGKVVSKDFKLIPVDDTVVPDPEVAKMQETFKEDIRNNYLKDYGLEYDQVIARSDYDFMTVDEMYSKENHGEFPMGKIIADSYIFAAQKNGYDVDVAAVGLGTIRDSIHKGDITTENAFEMCSLGVGSDGSAGHPLVIVNVTGAELKLLAELDASLGNMVNSIKMSYAGLNMEFNDARVPLDKLTKIEIVKPDGTTEPLVEDKLYSVCINVYAANMIGMVNDLTKGALSIVPKHADGTPVSDVYECALKDSEGNEVKEWVAFADYLQSFEKKDGISMIPEHYIQEEGRKVKIDDGGIEAVQNPGVPTVVVIVLMVLLAGIIILIIRKIIKKSAKKK